MLLSDTCENHGVAVTHIKGATKSCVDMPRREKDMRIWGITIKNDKRDTQLTSTAPKAL